MPSRSAFVGAGDVAVSAQPYSRMNVGRRFSFDVSEEVLSKIGRYALEQAIVNMAESVANMHRHQVEQAFFAALTDKTNREWMEPLLREALTKMFFTIVADIMATNAAESHAPNDRERQP